MYYELIFLGLVCVVAPYLAKAAGYKNGLMPFKLLGLSGFFFLMSAGFGLGIGLVESLHVMGAHLVKISVIVAWAMMLLGGLLSVIEVIRDLDHILVHKKA